MENKVLICAGSGGVGKTTLSATMAIRAAELGLSVLVLTIDPARRLADALGISNIDNDPKLVPGQNFPGKLYAAMIDPKQVFDSLVKNASATEAEAESLLKNRLYQQLSTTLNGVQEYTSLEKLHECVMSQQFDLVVLDTPPAKHAIDFLKSPQKFFNLFQDSVMKWFVSASDNRDGGFFGLFQKGTKLAFRAFELLVGSHLIDELGEFFQSIRAWQPLLREHSAAIHRLLTGSECKFILVTAFDQVKLEEAVFLKDELRKGGHSLGLVIINRVFPLWLHDRQQWAVEGDRNSEEKELYDHFNDLREYYEDRELAIQRFEEKIGGNVPILKLADFDFQIASLEGLKQVSDELVKNYKVGEVG